MKNQNLSIAESYYDAMNSKNLEKLREFLDPKVEFVSPFGKKVGRDSVLQAAGYFMTIFDSLKVDQGFSNEDQVMLTYKLECPEPIGHSRAAVLMTFKAEKISKVELFFDSKPFLQS